MYMYERANITEWQRNVSNSTGGEVILCLYYEYLHCSSFAFNCLCIHCSFKHSLLSLLISKRLRCYYWLLYADCFNGIMCEKQNLLRVLINLFSFPNSRYSGSDRAQLSSSSVYSLQIFRPCCDVPSSSVFALRLFFCLNKYWLATFKSENN